MRRYYASTKEPTTNTPTCYWRFVTTGLYSPDPAETSVKKLILPIRVTAANFPQDTPTRFFIDLPGIPDYAGAFSTRAWVVKTYRTSTATWTTWTMVAQGVTLGANQCKIFSNSSENGAVMEMHNTSIAENDLVYIDGYFTSTVFHSADANAVVKGITTVVIASSDSYPNSQIQADHVISTGDDAGAKIQAIIDDIEDNGNGYGGELVFMAGKYNFTTGITLISGLKIKTIGSVVFYFELAASGIGISGIDVSGIEISGITFLDNLSNLTHVIKIYEINTKQDIKITDCMFDNMDYAIHITSIINRSTCIWIERNIFNDIDANSCIYLNYLESVIISKNIIKNTDAYGIYLAGCERVQIEDNDISGGSTAAICVDYASSKITIQGGTITDAEIGIDINSENAKINGVVISDCNDDGINVYCDHAHIINNTIYSCAGAGINVQDSDYCFFQDNFCESNEYGMHFLTGSTYNQVIGNVLDTNTTDSILLDSGANYNEIRYNHASDITDSGTSNNKVGNW